MNNPEKLATRRCNQEWTIQRNWQHEGTIKNEQSRETGNIGYTRHKRKANKTNKHNTICVGDLHTQDTKRRQAKQKHNTICVGHHYTQTNINKVNKT